MYAMSKLEYYCEMGINNKVLGCSVQDVAWQGSRSYNLTVQLPQVQQPCPADSVAPVPVHEALPGEPLRHLGVDLPGRQFNRHLGFSVRVLGPV